MGRRDHLGGGPGGGDVVMTALRIPAIAVLFAIGIGPGDSSAQSWRTVQRAVRLGSAQWLNVDLGYAAGNVTFGPGEAGSLYRYTLRYDEDAFTPAIEFDREGSSLALSLVRVIDSFWDSSDRGSLELSVPPGIPLRLDLQLGASKADLEFGGLMIDALKVAVGAAEVEIRFSSPLARSPEIAHFEAGAADLRILGLGNLGAERVEVYAGVGRTLLDFGGSLTHDILVDLRMGLGELELRIPEDVGIDIERTGLLILLDAPGLQRDGDHWRSAGFMEAQRRVTVQLAGAVGRIKVVRTAPSAGGRELNPRPADPRRE